MVPITAIIAWGAIKVARIQAGARSSGTDPEVANRINALEQDLGGLRQELSEAQERLDFTERMLAQQRTDRLDAGK
ncbi:MAG: hypothetical protein ABJD11_08870 [Gemmatimonadota bacterium]